MPHTRNNRGGTRRIGSPWGMAATRLVVTQWVPASQQDVDLPGVEATVGHGIGPVAINKSCRLVSEADGMEATDRGLSHNQAGTTGTEFRPFPLGRGAPGPACLPMPFRRAY